MNITVERGNWLDRCPDLVVFVGDTYSDFVGAVPESVHTRLKSLSDGFAGGSLRREVFFTCSWDDERQLDCVYYHTSTLKGFTATESLKTLVAKALQAACDTGRKKVALILRGDQGEGLTEQVVEGSLVGTYSFRDYKKDKADPYADMELILCLASPQPVVPEVVAEPVVETLAEDKATSSESVVETIEATEAEADSDDSESPQSEADSEAEAVAEASEDNPEEAESEAADAEAEAVSESAEDSAEEPASEEASVSEDESAEESDSSSAASESEETEPDSQENLEADVPESVPTVPDEVWAALRELDESALQVGRAFADGVNMARDLVARPAADCTPDYLAKHAKKLSAAHGFSFQSFGPKQLKDHGYAGLVTVGKGADNSPRMMEMTYVPDEESEVHLVLLGKGVTFDSGGISIKGADKMHLMIGDMAGAAAVLGAMEVIGRLKPSIKVTGLVVSAENKPGSKSYRPGDIIEYKNGTSVHVENTDAEGRLILADGLIRAGELGATHIIDVATLTGACVRALGPSFTGVMGANRKLVNAITRAGGNHGESYWRLPMPLEYRDMLKSTHADLNNTGGPYAGATTAALFLKEFVPARTAWVHLDIAGTFWKTKPWKYYSEGPSGTGVKTLADLALRWKEHLG